MSKDNAADDTMRKYEQNADPGDTGQNPITGDVQPAISHPPENLGNDDSDAPIPTATPQSPVQTEDSPEITKDGTPEHRSNKGGDKTDTSDDRVYREAKDGNL